MGLGVMNAAARQAEACPTVWPAPDYRTVTDSVRDLFHFLGLDAANPLGRWIRPGMTVAIKPNWVKHEFGDNENRDVLYTHTSLVRVLIDAALEALGGHGRVVVADAPLQGCDFSRFRRQSGLAELETDYARAGHLPRPAAAVGRNRRCQQLRALGAPIARRSPGVLAGGSGSAQPAHVLRRKCGIRGDRLLRRNHQRASSRRAQLPGQ